MIEEPILLLGNIEIVDLQRLGFKDKAEHNDLFENALSHIRQHGSQPEALTGLRLWLQKDGTKRGLTEFMRGVKTPLTFPDHHVVGRHFGGCTFYSNETQIYRCTAYDPDYDYKLESVTGPKDVRKVSPRAINATFWSADDCGDYWFVCQWGVRVPKVRLCDRPADQAVQRNIGMCPVDPSAIAVHLDQKKERIIACEHCRGGSSSKGCGPNCIRGKTPEQANEALAAGGKRLLEINPNAVIRLKVEAVDY